MKNKIIFKKYIKAIDFLRGNIRGVEYTGDNKFFITEFDAVIKFLSYFSEYNDGCAWGCGIHSLLFVIYYF